jgi:hypothetical protein
MESFSSKNLDLIKEMKKITPKGYKHNKRSQGYQGQIHFQELHLTCGIPMLVYFFHLCMFHTQFIALLTIISF